MRNYNFKVDLKGIIQLLSENLYSNDSVFLRELLQNAVDAISARKAIDPEFTQGEITVRYISKGKESILEFIDNGIGLTKEEIHSFLSIIGQSSKRSEEVRGSFIGQFGIGLLSCFLVTNEIKVITRSVKEDSAYQWLGKSDGTYKVTEDPSKTSLGTEIHLHLTGSVHKKYNEREIEEQLSKYGYLVETPIFYEVDSNKTKKLNDNLIPWRQEFCTVGQIMEFGELLFDGKEFFDAIPIEGDNIQGFAYISGEKVSKNITHNHQIYLKDMFITDDGRDIIPQWAFFIQCIINAHDLTPTASRESFYRDGKLLKAKGQIEKCIIDYFVSLSKYDIKKLKTLTGIHNVAIKALATENDRIYQLFFPFLIFITNKGHLTGSQILNASKKLPVYYCVEIETYQRICPMLKDSNHLLINAGYIYDANLLERLPKFYRNIPITPFVDSAIENLFDDPSENECEEFERLLDISQKALDKFHCRTVLKRFSPDSVASLFVPGEDSFLADELDDDSFFSGEFANLLEDFSSDYTEIHSAKLFLNISNSLIQKLSSIVDAQLLEAIAQVLYVQALMAGHYQIGKKEMDVLGQNLSKLIEFGLS